MEYKVHDVIWTSEKIGRFWDYENNERKISPWFTMLVGDGIWNFTKKFIPVNAKILDYGAGQGFLSEHILKQTNKQKAHTIDCSEFSVAGLKHIEEKLSSFNNFGKTVLIKTFPLDVPDHSYDVIYFIEAIEHLTDEYLIPTLQEFKRLLKKNGILIVSTPNDENLDNYKYHCPDCGCVFHYMQHIRSFNSETLSSLMREVSFNTLFCGATDFNFHKNDLKNKEKIKKLLFSIIKRKQPHLVYIGKNI
jgi:2-polyprenyl-3-methyl-5-hydroxy-6-metoxy-1,4-benzoquinol methylase